MARLKTMIKSPVLNLNELFWNGSSFSAWRSVSLNNWHYFVIFSWKFLWVVVFSEWFSLANLENNWIFDWKETKIWSASFLKKISELIFLASDRDCNWIFSLFVLRVFYVLIVNFQEFLLVVSIPKNETWGLHFNSCAIGMLLKCLRKSFVFAEIRGLFSVSLKAVYQEYPYKLWDFSVIRDL